MKTFFASFFLPLAVAAADTNALPALAPPYGELPPSFWAQHETAIIVGGFALLAVVLLFLRVWLRPEMPVIVPPEMLARRTLEKLQAQPEDGKVLSEILQTLRRYISTVLEFPNTELTTAEFSAALAGNKKINAEIAQAVSNFLRECDVQKFSPTNSTIPLGAVKRAEGFVAQIQQQVNLVKQKENKL
jgi:hypothetical protein